MVSSISMTSTAGMAGAASAGAAAATRGAASRGAAAALPLGSLPDITAVIVTATAATIAPTAAIQATMRSGDRRAARLRIAQNEPDTAPTSPPPASALRSRASSSIDW